jgi:hypothetical protein
MIHVTDLHRELGKVYSVLEKVDTHLRAKDQMNAALHMSSEVRPTPLAASVRVTTTNLGELMDRLVQGVDNTSS